VIGVECWVRVVEADVISIVKKIFVEQSARLEIDQIIK